ncbi:hypothetical protein [Microbispora sp. NPDC046933]|uniref:hypothetical protein n=1 Tax=Microbispora sp. NPDC046933 TaxID=3155618 RepID=UPI0033DA065A
MAKQGRWIELAGTSAQLDDAGGRLPRLESYVLTEDADNSNVSCLRVGNTFLKTPYRQTPVAKGGRWAAGVPDHRQYLPADRIVLIDRVHHRDHTVKLPVRATSAQWSPNGRTLLLTAYRKKGSDYRAIGFITVDVRERKPKLVEAGDTWSIGAGESDRDGRFFWNGDGTGVLSMLKDDAGIAVYDLDGRRTRVYRGIGRLSGHITSLFSPSGRWFVSAGEGKAPLQIVDTATGKIAHRLPGAFQGWYDEDHVVTERRSVPRPSDAATKMPTVTFRIVGLDGRPGKILVKEKIRHNDSWSGYKPHIEWLDFVPPLATGGSTT